MSDDALASVRRQAAAVLGVEVDDLPAMFSSPQLARLMGTSGRTVERWAELGDAAPFPHFRASRVIRWPAEPVLRVLAGLPARSGVTTGATDATGVPDTVTELRRRRAGQRSP